jgi:hypothetical protein
MFEPVVNAQPVDGEQQRIRILRSFGRHARARFASRFFCESFQLPGPDGLLWLLPWPTAKRIKDGNPGTLEIRHGACHCDKSVFQRCGRNHEVGTVMAESCAEGVPTPRGLQIEEQDPLA